MKIFSEMLEGRDHNNKPVPVFALYFDTQATGDPERDIKHAAGVKA